MNKRIYSSLSTYILMSNTKNFAVIFDLDGLLADTEPLWGKSAAILLERKNRKYDPSLKPRVMGRHPLEVAKLYVEHFKLDDKPEDLLSERLEIVRNLYQKGITACAGTNELVTKLYCAKTKMAVASGSPSWLIKIALEQLNLDKQLPCFVGSNCVQNGKPAPDLFLLAAKLLSIKPKNCIVLEDSAAGIEAALAANMICVAVPSPETPTNIVDKAHVAVKSLTELSPTILQHLYLSYKKQ